MLTEFEDDLVKTIKEVCDTRNYLGEFDNADELELLIKSGKEFAFVEFTDEKYADTVNRYARFKIHLLTCTLSANRVNRQESKHKAVKLIESIDNKLLASQLCNEFQIDLKELKPLLNRITDYGYIYVLSREIEARLLEPSPSLTEGG